MIHTSLSPNTTIRDLALALYWIVAPWNWGKWKTGSQTEQLKLIFSHIVNAKYAVSFNSGRDALTVALQTVGVTSNDEVILQPYTCIVVPHAIIKCGAKPVYADVKKETFNINPEDIATQITEKTKAVIVQHTFGHPAEVQAIKELCDRHDIRLIEDCAHSIGGQADNKLLGTFGDVAIWSFGRDKVISGTWGGMLTTNDTHLHGKAEALHAIAPQPVLIAAFQVLLHPLVMAIAKPMYNLLIGKLIIVMAQKLRLINRVLFPEEKQARVYSVQRPTESMHHSLVPQVKRLNIVLPKRMTNASATLILGQLKRLNAFTWHRRNIAEVYEQSLSKMPGITCPPLHESSPLLRYTILVQDAHHIYNSLLKQGIQLGNWYHHILEPEVDPSLFGYIPGSCPNAEELVTTSLNLPTHIQISKKQAHRLCDALRLSLSERKLQ